MPENMTARDYVVEGVFQEREQLVKRTKSLDIVEELVNTLTDAQLEAIVETPDVLIRAAQLHARRVVSSPCGGAGKPPCGQRR
jgi:hypothetical protein